MCFSHQALSSPPNPTDSAATPNPLLNAQAHLPHPMLHTHTHTPHACPGLRPAWGGDPGQAQDWGQTTQTAAEHRKRGRRPRLIPGEKVG